jgi:preprotein translocase SecE subunit
MAVIRSRKDSLPSDVVPGGDAGGTAPPSTPVAPADRTKSALQSSNTAARAGAGRVVPERAARGPAARANAAAQQSSAPSDPKTFINDTMAELKRVVWPTNEEVRAGTIVTVGLLVFFSLYIFVLDQLAEKLFAALGFYS